MAAPSLRHHWYEDLQGLLYGAGMGAVGLLVLTHLGLVTGQTAGLALLISYGSGWDFGPVFFVVNLPFYVLAWRRFGPGFTFRTFAAVAMLSALVQWLPAHMAFAALTPWVGAVLAGALSGSALLALFRHGASLGGIGILALLIQDRTGFRAGWVQLIVDAAIFGVALTMLPAERVALSALGAAVLNLVIAVNHRRDRYIA